jgi:hypothetical protein
VIGELLFSIWLQRNRCIFDDEPFNAPIITALFRARIQQAASSATPLEAIPGFIATFDSFIEQLHNPT